ncbi:MAG: transposase [Thermoplasmatales archaeon]
MQVQLNIVKEIISSSLQDCNDGKKRIMGWFLNTVMKEKARIQIVILPYERSEERRRYRNGSRTRTLKAAEGKLELKKPQIRELPFKTNVFERYSSAENVFNSVILESYIQCVSAGNVMNVVESLGVESISTSYVSAIAS